MAAATGLTTGSEIGLYFNLETPPAPSAGADTPYLYGDIVKANGLVTDDDDHFLGECTDIGGITKSANTKEIGFFRAKAKRRIPGIPSFEDMTFTVAVDFSKAGTRAIRDANPGAPCHLAVVWNTDPDKQDAVQTSTQVTVGYIRGELASASVNPQMDDETTMDVVVSPSDDVDWLDQA